LRPADLTHYRLPPAWRWFKAFVWRVEHDFERTKASGRALDHVRFRVAVIMAVFAAMFMMLMIGAARLALVSNTGDAAAGRLALPGARGDLVDRNGQMLAVDLPHFGIYVDPREIWDTSETRRVLAVAVPELDMARLERALQGRRREFLLGGMTPEQKARLQDLGLPGISFEDEQRRVYPLGATAAHLIGFSGKGGAGLAGAERALDQTVRNGAAGHEAIPLAIDLRVQSALEDEVQKAVREFQAKAAVGLVTNVHTGEVLGMVSYPDFDSNLAGQTSPDLLLNRAAAQVYEMGSIFKVFTVATGLDSGAATLSTTFDATTPITIDGQTIHDYHPENRVMTLSDTFLHSSNIATSRLALSMGPNTMQDYFRKFGLFSAAPIELAETTRPLLPRQWTGNIVATTSFGHSISVTPLAIASGMGAIFNGGTFVPLTIRKAEPGAVPSGRRVVSQATARSMLDLMRLNVTNGTGGRAEMVAPGYRIGGKTGSAEKIVGGRYDHAKLVSTFAAVFPTDGAMEANRYFILILLDEPKGNKASYGFATGGWTAAPTAGRVVERIAPYLGVKRVVTPVPLTTANTVAPERLNGGEL
jgi:cell division protein FtsI (penicillin-binding protein 3)